MTRTPKPLTEKDLHALVADDRDRQPWHPEHTAYRDLVGEPGLIAAVHRAGAEQMKKYFDAIDAPGGESAKADLNDKQIAAEYRWRTFQDKSYQSMGGR